jgi:cation diffusion facilitator family transporter
MSIGKAMPDMACATLQHVHHDHGFGQGARMQAEGRTLLVAGVTIIVMVLEIVAGLWTGSMALLADGVHMGGHAVALGLAASAYALSRRYARDRRLSLGSGKINDLAAYTSALLLAASTVWLVVESVSRLLHPEPLHAVEAMAVAALGLAVNLLSAWLLAGAAGHDHPHRHGHASPHDHHEHHDHHLPGRPAHVDHNLRAALLHVLADAATSVAAILGLLGAWLWGWNWLDPLIALAAALLVMRWAWGLLRQTGSVLLDAEAPQELRREAQACLEGVAQSQVIDLHLWSVGQGGWTLVASVVSHQAVAPGAYKAALAGLSGLHHPMIEIHSCLSCGDVSNAD